MHKKWHAIREQHASAKVLGGLYIDCLEDPIRSKLMRAVEATGKRFTRCDALRHGMARLDVKVEVTEEGGRGG